MNFLCSLKKKFADANVPEMKWAEPVRDDRVEGICFYFSYLCIRGELGGLWLESGAVT